MTLSCHFLVRLSRNLGASSSWNPKGLSRPVMGFFCPYLRDVINEFDCIYLTFCEQIAQFFNLLKPSGNFTYDQV
jgi:hypothetical protein